MDLKFFLKTLVETESPSYSKAAVDRVGAIVAAEARRLGAQIEIIPNQETGDHVLAHFSSPPAKGIRGEGEKPILLLCHMDTVFPLGTLSKMPYREADGKIFGPGTLDMKSGIVISLAAIEAAREKGLARPVTLLCTSDEEIGSQTSRPWIESLARESALVLVLESAMPDGSLKTWRKGVGNFQVRTKGRAAHAGGAHEMGCNAIEEMAHQVIAIQKLTDYSRKTTLNVGVIHGGMVSNVVPEEAEIDVDVRVMEPGEWERLEGEMNNLKPVLQGTSIEVSGNLNRPPMPFDDRMKTTFERAVSLAVRLGMDLKAGGTGGGSDANFVAPLGISLLDGLGAVGEGHHSEREYILAESLFERSKLVSLLLTDW
jgi:glutamate carboxypeptidase